LSVRRKQKCYSVIIMVSVRSVRYSDSTIAFGLVNTNIMLYRDMPMT